MKINLEEYCGFNEKYSNKIRVKDFQRYSKNGLKRYIKRYEEKHGTSKKFRYQYYFNKLEAL